jgi:Lon protease-like protein
VRVPTLVFAAALIGTLLQAPPAVGNFGLPAALAARVATAFQRANAIALPAEIPLFPLPEVVLFPGVRRPLQIYEPRYRDMIADALKGNRIIGTVLLQPGFEADYEGRPPVYAIGCAGVIEDYELLPDGRYVILLRGLTTFRIASEDQRKPYRVARVEAIPELLKDGERGPLTTARSKLADLLNKTLPVDVEPPDPGLEDVEFVNITAQALAMSEADRQNLLERNSVLARARALLERLSK